MKIGDGYKSLAAAIVSSVVRDYRKAKRQLAVSPSSESAKHSMEEVERFFKSELYQTLCDVNPDIIGIAKKEGIAI